MKEGRPPLGGPSVELKPPFLFSGGHPVRAGRSPLGTLQPAQVPTVVPTPSLSPPLLTRPTPGHGPREAAR